MRVKSGNGKRCSAGVRAGPTQEQRIRHERPVIVLVDDDPAVVELLSDRFADAGCQTVGCLSSREASLGRTTSGTWLCGRVQAT